MKQTPIRKAANMKTVLRSYMLYASPAMDDAASVAYSAIVEKMKARGTKCYRAIGASQTCYYHEFASGENGATIELDPTYIFENQWNTLPIKGVTDSGLRVFDWAEYASESAGMSPHWKCGHYLELTDEMTAARAARGQCGYCGTQYQKPYPTFCEACTGSEYLTAEYIQKGATRIYPVLSRNWRPLSEAEAALLLPRFQEAQIHGVTARDKKRITQMRADLATEYEKAVRDATTKRDGFLWLMDHGINTNNVIFYDHTGMFAIGWRNPIEPTMRDIWTEQMRDFPFQWEFSRPR